MTNNILKNLIFGTWFFDSYQKIPHKKIVDLINYAYEVGFRRFDTAESYGNGLSEMLLGRSIKKNRDNIEVYSKFSFHHSKKKEIKNAVEKTLKRLNTDYIDIYFQHWPNLKEDNNRTIESLLELKEKSYIKKIGVSNWEISDFETLEYIDYIDTAQICLNPLWQNSKDKLIPYLNKKKIDIFSYSPFAQGLLLKKHFNPEDNARKKLIFLNKQLLKEVNKFKAELLNLSKKENLSLLSILVNWNLSSVDALICSATKREQIDLLKNNLEIIKIDKKEYLNARILELSENIRNITAEYPNMWNWIR